MLLNVVQVSHLQNPTELYKLIISDFLAFIKFSEYYKLLASPLLFCLKPTHPPRRSSQKPLMRLGVLNTILVQ